MLVFHLISFLVSDFCILKILKLWVSFWCVGVLIFMPPILNEKIYFDYPPLVSCLERPFPCHDHISIHLKVHLILGVLFLRFTFKSHWNLGVFVLASVAISVSGPPMLCPAFSLSECVAVPYFSVCPQCDSPWCFSLVFGHNFSQPRCRASRLLHTQSEGLWDCFCLFQADQHVDRSHYKQIRNVN